MATSDELKKQQELNKSLQDENELLRKRNRLQSEGYDMSSSLVESLKEVLGIRTRQTTFEQDILNTNKEINKSILSQKSGLQDLNTTKNQIRKNNDLISKASVLQLGLEKSLGESAKKSVDRYVHKVSLQQQMQKDIDLENEKLERGEKIDEEALKLRKERLSLIDEQAQREFGLLGDLGKQLAISKLNTVELQKQTEERKKDKEMLLKLQASMGIAGALVKTLGSIPGLGDASAKAFEDVERKLKADAEATGKVASRWKTFGMLASETSKHLGQALTDPAVILTSIFATYLKINKASADTAHLTGQNAVAAASWGANYATAVDYLETINELTKQTGMNAQNIFSQQVIGQAAALKTTMGLSAEEAGGLATMSQTAGREVNNVVDSVVDTTSAFNKANRAAVSQGAVLREVANTSDSIKLSLGNNPEALTKAAAAATRLGLSLKDVDNIAASLTDFQSSISNELEAELLTGKDLNLEKARELALNNDLEGVSKELFKNSSDIAEFGKMNRIQQESYAKALGMTKDQLAKMAYNKALEAGMTEEQAAAAANVNAEDMKRVAAQENFAKALEKIAGAVAPILDVVGDFLSMPFVPYLLMGGFAVMKIGGGLLSSAKSMGSLAKSTLDFVKNLNMKGVTDFFGGLKDKVGSVADKFKEGFASKVQEKAAGAGGSISEKLGDKVQDKVGEKVEGLTDKVAGASEKSEKVKGGSGIKTFLTDLGAGLQALAESFKKIGIQGFGYIALGMAIVTGAAIGLGYALGLAAPGIEAFGKVITAVFDGLGVIIATAAEGFVKIMGAVSMDNIGPMLLLGPALFGIAAGLGAIGVAGITAIPGVAALTALAVLAPALTGLATAMGMGEGSKSVGEVKGKGEEGSMAAVEKKLQQLIDLVKEGGDVYLDTNKVGKAQVLGTFKSK